MRSAVNAFTGMFAARDGSEAHAAAKLYKELLGRALAELPPGVGRLVIVADGDRVPVPGGRGPGLVQWTLGLIAVLAAALLARHYRKA